MKSKRQHRITLVLGGARSGKSTYASRLAEARFERPLYLATAEAFDEEMKDRIDRHRAARGSRWACLEEPLEVPRALLAMPGNVDGVLLDCVTVWLCNVFMKDGGPAVEARRGELVAALQGMKKEIVIVSNEVGMGIVPDNPMSREFRDHAGWLNQDLAEIADHVVLVVAGIPMILKGKKQKL